MDASARRSFHIGRYHCVEALSQGPLGETFRAKVYGVAGLEKQYALKQIDAAVRVDPAMRARLVDAARRYAMLDHERIARLTEFHDEEDGLFLVVELARGIDLQRLATHLRGRGESLPVDQAILIAVDIAEALDAAAQTNVLHEGLNPHVIAVLGEGEVRVSDFALASALERPGWVTDDLLAPLLAYTAPERLLGRPASSASDAWSVGALLYELCTSTPLLSGATAAEVAASRTQGPSWDKLPSRPGLRENLQRLLSDDPAARPQSPAELREVLAGLLGLEIGRARSGLQSLAKRALGRALTRTGSFAAVAIPSGSMPTLVQEPVTPPAAPTTLQSGKRTLMGVATHTHSAPTTPAANDTHSWAPPPRTTGAMPISRIQPIPGATTLPGIGDPAPVDEMELAELPPSAASTPSDSTQRTHESSFEEGVTSPEARRDEESIDVLEEPSLAGEGFEMINSYDITMNGADPKPPPVPPSGKQHTLPPPPTPIVTQPSQLTIEMTADVPPGVEVTGPQAKIASDDVKTPPVGAASVPEVAKDAPKDTATTTPSMPLQRPTQPMVAPAPKAGNGGVATGLVVGLIVIGAGVLFMMRRPAPPTTLPTMVAQSEQPKAEEPKVDAPKVDAPKVEAPKVEAPKVAKTESPKVEAPIVPASAGQVAVHTTPPGAQVWLDGEQKGTTPLVAQATAGKHKLVIAGEGQKLITRQITVESAGLTLDQALEPAKLPAEIAGTNEGGLKVRCHSQGELRIFVDGADTGLTCPNDVRISVEPGTHKIGLVSARTGETHELDGEILEDADHSTRIYVRY